MSDAPYLAKGAFDAVVFLPPPPVRGPNFEPDKMPVVVAFFRKVARNIGTVVGIVKDCREQPRPFLADAQIHPPGQMQQETAIAPGTAEQRAA